MGRPRKYPERMTRLVQARVSDAQYEWLVENAVDFHEGELSAAVRGAIEQAQIFGELLMKADPPGELAAMIERGHQEEGRELYFEEHGHYPEAADDD
jgi:hypothetical protein